MIYRKKEKRCGTCHFWQGLGAGHFCDKIGMTGESRVKAGEMSDGPYRPCNAWEPRNEAERQRMSEERRRGKFNESLDERGEMMRTAGEGRKLRARDELREADRGDVARALGMSSRAAEALYGGSKL